MHRKLIAGLLLLLLGPLTGAPQHGNVTTSANPFSSSEDLVAGAGIFRSRCAGCHGLDGAGGADGPDLTTGSFRRASTDVDLFRIVRVGIPGTSMTAFDLDGREVWQVVAHVRSLGVGRAAQEAKGNAAEGAAVFRRSGCFECHRVSGEGGHLGPDLTEVGTRRSLADLRRSLVAPDGEVSPENWRVRARTRKGEVVTGVRLNEDTYSYQIRDSGGRLRSLPKAELLEHEIVRTSAMPSFRDKLGERELEDLLAYLASQGRAGAAGASR